MARETKHPKPNPRDDVKTTTSLKTCYVSCGATSQSNMRFAVGKVVREYSGRKHLGILQQPGTADNTQQLLLHLVSPWQTSGPRLPLIRQTSS